MLLLQIVLRLFLLRHQILLLGNNKEYYYVQSTRQDDRLGPSQLESTLVST